MAKNISVYIKSSNELVVIVPESSQCTEIGREFIKASTLTTDDLVTMNGIATSGAPFHIDSIQSKIYFNLTYTSTHIPIHIRFTISTFMWSCYV